MVAEIQSIVTNRVQCIDTLAAEKKTEVRNRKPRDVFSQKFGVDEAKTNTDDAIMEIATGLEVLLTAEQIVVSHRVGKPNQSNGQSSPAYLTTSLAFKKA